MKAIEITYIACMCWCSVHIIERERERGGNREVGKYQHYMFKSQFQKQSKKLTN